MNSRVWNQVCLELVQIHIQSAIKPQRARDAGDNLRDQTVQMLKAWSWDIQVATADIIYSLIVNKERAVRVLNRRVCGQNSVIGLDNGGGDSWRRVDSELEFGFLAVVCGKTLKQERAKTRSSSSAKGVEDQETLEARAIVLFAFYQHFALSPYPAASRPTKTRRILSSVPSRISLPMV